jgi:hypothetical protein
MRPPESGLPWKLYHDLWTKAVGTPGYDKEKWRILGQLIFGDWDVYVKRDLEKVYEREKGFGCDSVQKNSDERRKRDLDSRLGLAIPRPVQSSDVGGGGARHVFSHTLDRNVLQPGEAERTRDPIRTGEPGREKTLLRELEQKQSDFIGRAETYVQDKFEHHQKKTHAYGNAGNIASAILALAEVIAIGMEKLDKPRFIQVGPIDFTHRMDPGDYQNTHRQGKPIDKG